MTTGDEPRRLVEIGVIPSGYDAMYIDGPDPVSAMIAEASARLDREAAEAERVRLAAIADHERVRKTRRARTMRHLMRAIRARLK